MRYRQSPKGVLRRVSAYLVERSGQLHGARAVGWTLIEKRRAFQAKVWQRQPGSRLSRQAPWALCGRSR